MSTLRILLGMPDRASTGGPVACEPPFAEELRRVPGLEVSEETYVYADGRGLPVWTRIARVLRTARRLRRRLSAERFDLLHLNSSFDTMALLRDFATLVCLRSFRMSGNLRATRIFLKFHGSDAALLETKNALLGWMGRRVLARADGIGVLSSEERDNFLRAGAEALKVFVVRNAVRKLLDQPDEDFRGRMGIDEGVPVLLFIARFIPAKGLMDTLRACLALRERGVRFALLCVGDGPARAEAESFVAREGLEACVRFCGYVPEERTGEFYANATALLFPTYHYEGFPMVIFYAVAAGTPVITTRIRAAADYLKEPDNCLWVEPKNPPLLAAKIEHLLSHPELRERIRLHNLELAQKFTAEAVTSEYVQVYREITSRGR
jgi:glycosyltransferase involved in cell wall biosynthesis